MQGCYHLEILHAGGCSAGIYAELQRAPVGGPWQGFLYSALNKVVSLITLLRQHCRLLAEVEFQFISEVFMAEAFNIKSCNFA